MSQLLFKWDLKEIEILFLEKIPEIFRFFHINYDFTYSLNRTIFLMIRDIYLELQSDKPNQRIAKNSDFIKTFFSNVSGLATTYYQKSQETLETPVIRGALTPEILEYLHKMRSFFKGHEKKAEMEGQIEESEFMDDLMEDEVDDASSPISGQSPIELLNPFELASQFFLVLMKLNWETCELYPMLSSFFLWISDFYLSLCHYDLNFQTLTQRYIGNLDSPQFLKKREELQEYERSLLCKLAVNVQSIFQRMVDQENSIDTEENPSLFYWEEKSGKFKIFDKVKQNIECVLKDSSLNVKVAATTGYYALYCHLTLDNPEYSFDEFFKIIFDPAH